MAYQKVPRPSTVYHLTQKGNLDSILDDGVIRRFNDTECWFCESLDKMKAVRRIQSSSPSNPFSLSF